VLEIEETVTIVQSTERMWAFVVDEANDPLWQATLIDVLEGRLRGLKAGS